MLYKICTQDESNHVGSTNVYCNEEPQCDVNVIILYETATCCEDHLWRGDQQINGVNG